MAAHATLSPSSAPRWMRCAGSVTFTSDDPDESSIYANEGTAAHIVSDECLTLGMDVEDFLGRELVIGERIIEVLDEIVRLPGDKFTVSREWVRWLQPGIDRMREFGGEFFSEHRVDLSRWLGPNQFGTLDRGIVLPDLIVISDLKFGAGVPVHPEENEQLMLYGVGFWHKIARHKTKARDVLINIDQPRADGGGGDWYTTVDHLLEFAEYARARAEETRKPNAKRIAGEKQCQWCTGRFSRNGRPSCAAYVGFNLDILGIKAEDIDRAAKTGKELRLPESVELTPERRSEIVRNMPMLRKFLDIVHADTLTDALAGRPTPGLKAVKGRALPRRWIDEERAERFLIKNLSAEGAFNKKLKSPSQAEDELGKEALEKLNLLCRRDDPKPILVPDTDKRDALRPLADKFDDLDDEDDE